MRGLKPRICFPPSTKAAKKSRPSCGGSTPCSFRGDCASCPCGTCKAACFYISIVPRRCRRDLADSAAQDILRECGYGKCSRAESCLSCLIGRLRNNADFPHEVGLFLGYPPEDVRGFIENRASGFKLIGCWKVYGDVDAARKKFESFESCTHRSRGKALDEIIQ